MDAQRHLHSESLLVVCKSHRYRAAGSAPTAFCSQPYRYLVPITIGPAFLTAAIYLTLARIIPVYGHAYSRFKPRTYTITFITCDFISLLLQAIGGAITSIADSGSSTQNMGVNIMIAGLSFQVVSLFVFISLSADFAFSVFRAKRKGSAFAPQFSRLRATGRFKLFLCGKLNSISQWRS